MLGRWRFAGGVALFLALPVFHQRAEAAICSATAFSCPPTGTCIITGTWEVDAGCVLDFGARPVELRGTLQAADTGASFALKASDLTLYAGKLKSVGDANSQGGDISVELSGALTMSGTGPRIDTGGNGGGGAIAVVASTINLGSGLVAADGGVGDDCGDAGDIDLQTTGGALSIDNTIRSSTAGNDCYGGTVSLTGSAVSVTGDIDARGGASASEDGVLIHALSGDVLVLSGATLRAEGTGQPDGSGANGGAIVLVADLGNILLAAPTILNGKSPDGVGGSLQMVAGGSITATSSVKLFGGSSGFGGDLFADAGGDLSVTGEVTVTGGMTFPYGEGGIVDLRSLGQVAIGSTIDVSAATGGSIAIADASSTTVSGILRATGSRGPGGTIEALGCSVSVTGTVDAGSSNGGTAGSIDLFAGSSISLGATATVKALPCSEAHCTFLTTRTGSVSINPSATLWPSPLIAVDPLLPPC